MTSLDLVSPRRLLVTVLPLLYGGLLLLGLPHTARYLLITCGVVLLAIMIVARLEYPMLAMWPAFAGLFLIGASVCALIENVVDYAFVPFTDSDAEIVLAIWAGIAFILWGIQTMRKMIAHSM